MQGFDQYCLQHVIRKMVSTLANLFTAAKGLFRLLQICTEPELQETYLASELFRIRAVAGWAKHCRL